MIVTHTSPDWDAIGAVWLLVRFAGMDAGSVQFVNTGNPDRAVLAAAAAVVDTGREYDPARFRFDHHQFPGSEANDDSATSLVYADVVNPQRVYGYLDPLIRLIYEGDTGKPGANPSRETGIHALLSAQKARRLSDDALLAWGMDILDLLAERLKAQAQARASLAQHTIYRSKDGLVRALAGAPQGATFAAFEDGARLVVFTSDNRDHDPPSVAVGVMRGGEGQEPDCRALVLGLLNDGECEAPWAPRWDSPEYHEMARWFLHPAGFFAGRGTQKAPDPTPLTASLLLIAQALDGAWKR